jgi:hypothetical protein
LQVRGKNIGGAFKRVEMDGILAINS